VPPEIRIPGQVLLTYIAKRVFSALITIWFIMTLTFFLMNAVPGDPFTSEKMRDLVLRDAMMAKYGLDKPLFERYGKYMLDYLKGDFGLSYAKRGLTTNQIIAAGFPYSLRIGIYASIMILVLGIFFGLLAALRHNKFIDRFLMFFSTLGATIPSFVFATGFLYVFSKLLGLVPPFGVESWQGYIGPVTVLGIFSLAYIVRLTRSSLLDILNQDYIRTARAKGLPEWKVLCKHAMRNAILPVVSYMGPMFAALITGSLVVEKVFGIPGIGSLFSTSILNRDYTLIMGITVFFAVLLVFFVLVMDIVYVLVDPRIKYE
jgi:oligopeptide transport system permease protein